MKKINLIAMIAGFLAVSSAHAEFGVLGGMSTVAPSITSTGFTYTNKTSMALAGGVYYARHLGPVMKLEIDALYVKRKVEVISTIPTDNIRESTALQIPVLLRLNVIPTGLLNVGVGGYYEMALGDNVDDTDVTNNVPKTAKTYSALSTKKSDYGALGSIQLRFSLAPMTKIIIDGRYVYGMSEQSTDTTSFTMKNRYTQAFAGVSFGM